MAKLFIFAILLAATPTSGLLETLFLSENNCYIQCRQNYPTVTAQLEACKKGCDFKLHNEDCTNQCKSYSPDEETQASCQVGCTLSNPANEGQSDNAKIAIDPVPETKPTEHIPTEPEVGRPRSIILIRLRQRPSVEFPSVQNFFNEDPVKMFNDIVQRFQERANEFEQTIRKSFEQNSQEPLKIPDINAVQEFPRLIPIVHIPNNFREDSSSESSEEKNEKSSVLIGDRFIHNQPNDLRSSPNSRFEQIVSKARNEWNELLRKQPKVPTWIFIGILLSSSAILWYMVMSLCRQTPTRGTLSIRAQELVFHPYEYDACEKEKIQPDEQPYEVTESLPIKVKLTNI